MADITPILIKDLAAQTTMADTDYMIIGGADAKKITVAQMKEALGINKLNTEKTIYDSYNGMNIVVRIKGSKSVKVKITGSPTVNLGTGTQYAYCGSAPDLKDLLLDSIIKYIFIGSVYYGQLKLDKDTGAVQIGYTRSVNDSSTVSIPAGTEIWVEETITF